MTRKTLLTTMVLFAAMVVFSSSAMAQEFDSFGYYNQYDQNYYPPQGYVYDQSYYPQQDYTNYQYQQIQQPYYEEGYSYQQQPNYNSPVNRAVRYGALGAVIGALGSSHNHGTNALKGAGIGAAAGLLLGR